MALKAVVREQAPQVGVPAEEKAKKVSNLSP